MTGGAWTTLCALLAFPVALSYRHCPELAVGGGPGLILEFPLTQVGDISYSLQICNETGIPIASAECVEVNGWIYFDVSGGNRTHCSGTVVEKYMEGHHHFWEKSGKHDEENKEKIKLNDEELFASLENLTSMSLSAFTHFTDNINQILSPDFQDSEQEDASHKREEVVGAMDRLVDIVQLDGSGQLTLDTKEMIVQILDVDLDTNESSVGFTPPNNSSSVEFDIPMNSIRQISSKINSSIARVGFVLYKTSYLFASPNFTTNQVISATVRGNDPNSKLQEPVAFSFQSISNTNKSARLTCGFWDFTIDGWSTEGCALYENIQPPKCVCDHLTNFAILVDISGRNMENPQTSAHDHTGSHTVVVDYIGDVGSVLSIAGLTLTVIIHIAFKSLRRRRPQIILTHLSISLLLAYTIFFFGISATDNYIVCAFITVMLHYFWLVAWCWMAVEGYTMYTLLVKVLASDQSHYIAKSCVFAYGAPFAIVSVSAGYSLFYRDANTWKESHRTEIHKVLAENSEVLVQQHFALTGEAPVNVSEAIGEDEWRSSYVSRSVCWPHGNPLYFGFLLPVGLIISFNIVTFIIILRSLAKGRRKIQSTVKKQTLVQQLSNLITMSVLLGLSWCFGFLAMISNDPLYLDVMQGIHTILTSIQGFILFILFCVRHDVVRKTWTQPILDCLPFHKEPKTEVSHFTRNYPCLDEEKHHHHRHSGNRRGVEKQRDSVSSQPASVASSASSKRKSLNMKH